jgi:hypothetical protein
VSAMSDVTFTAAVIGLLFAFMALDLWMHR